MLSMKLVKESRGPAAAAWEASRGALIKKTNSHWGRIVIGEDRGVNRFCIVYNCVIFSYYS